MKIPFITYRETDSSGELQYFICQKVSPHYVGMIIDNPNFESVHKVPIPNTIMYVAYAGIIDGWLYPMHSHAKQEINGILVVMAEWYWTNRISKNQQKYKKWLLSNQVQPTSY